MCRATSQGTRYDSRTPRVKGWSETRRTRLIGSLTEEVVRPLRPSRVRPVCGERIRVEDEEMRFSVKNAIGMVALIAATVIAPAAAEPDPFSHQRSAEGFFQDS